MHSAGVEEVLKCGLRSSCAFDNGGGLSAPTRTYSNWIEIVVFYEASDKWKTRFMAKFAWWKSDELAARWMDVN